MEVFYVPSSPDPAKPLRASVFLAGPCPRESDVLDWRHQCCELFRRRGFDGSIFWPVPQRNEFSEEPSCGFNLDAQVAWETRHLRMADVILFWIPRKVDSPMLGLTTNVEFGLYLERGNFVLGYPLDAERMRYLKWWADKTWLPFDAADTASIPSAVHTLEETVDRTIAMLTGWGYTSNNNNTGALQRRQILVSEEQKIVSPPLLPRADVLARYFGEQYVPLLLWRSRCFQDYYAQQRKQGNEIVWAHVEWKLQIPNRKNFNRTAFLAVLKVHMKIGAENGRIKDNEVVVFRPDTAAVIAYYVPVSSGTGKSKETNIKSVPPEQQQEEEEEEEEDKDRCYNKNDILILLTKEYRSPVRNELGVVAEPASGSSWDLVEYSLPAQSGADAHVPASAEEAAAALAAADAEARSHKLHEMAMEELAEETGLDSIPASRVTYVASRQLAGTLSAHCSHVFAVRLTDEEFERCNRAAKEGVVFGVEADTERTTIQFESFGNLLAKKGAGAGVDWATLGMVSQVVSMF